MMDSATLIADPVFQLNTILWALQDLPDNGETRPVLREAGYYLLSIGRRLIVPVDPATRAKLLKAVGGGELTPTNPDVWLRHVTDGVIPLLELKSHGFGADSSNSVQALKFLASGWNVGPSLGAKQDDVVNGHLLYVTVQDDAGKLLETLMTLSSTLEEQGVPVAKAGVIAIMLVQDGIALASPDVESLPLPAKVVLEEPALVLQRSNPNDNLRPLYFVPWLPGIHDSQDATLQAEGLSELTARVLNEVLSRVGIAQPPAVLTIDVTDVLRSATFGIFPTWRDNDRRGFIDQTITILEQTLKGVGSVHRVGQYFELDLPDENVQVLAIERLESADPNDPSRNLEPLLQKAPEFFDRDLRVVPEAAAE